MPKETKLCIRQDPPVEGRYPIRLTLERSGQAKIEAQAAIEFALTPREQEELRWYLEDYLHQADSVEDVRIAQVEGFMRQRGEELYAKVLRANAGTQALWFAVREQLGRCI